MTPESLRYFGELSLTFHERLRQSLRFPLLELANTHGRGGKTSKMVSTDTLMLWFDMLPRKEKEKFWTLIADLLTPHIAHGTVLRV